MFFVEMILTILIVQLKVRRLCFAEFFFLRIEFGQGFQIGRAFVIVALVNGAECLLFPAIQGVCAMGTPEFGFGLSEPGAVRRL